MGKKDKGSLFNLIAPIYALFYNMQKKRFVKILERAGKELDLQSFRTVIDIGCGTGALCSVLHEKGLTVTGVDPAEKMLQAAKKKSGTTSIQFVRADVLQTLPYKDKEFDISIASYVAHGLQPEHRLVMYAEMSRITKDKVIIHDYNANRSLLTTLIEWLERGDYFHFIKVAEKEMKDCTSRMNPCFSEVTIINVDTRAAWYICTPASNSDSKQKPY